MTQPDCRQYPCRSGIRSGRSPVSGPDPPIPPAHEFHRAPLSTKMLQSVLGDIANRTRGRRPRRKVSSPPKLLTSRGRASSNQHARSEIMASLVYDQAAGMNAPRMPSPHETGAMEDAQLLAQHDRAHLADEALLDRVAHRPIKWRVPQNVAELKHARRLIATPLKSPSRPLPKWRLAFEEHVFAAPQMRVRRRRDGDDRGA